VSYDDWPEDAEPDRYVRRDDPRCRSHTSELETNCRLCRSEAIANHNREPENIPVPEFRDRPKRRPPHLNLAPVIPLNPRRSP
jgi:hypothetical protein